MELIGDVLDTRVVDRNGHEMGRVDSLIIEVRPGEAPRVTAIEIGAAVLAYRVRPVVGRCVAALQSACGMGDGRPTTIAFSKVRDIGDRVTVDVTISETSAGRVERWLRRWIGVIPGSS